MSKQTRSKKITVLIVLTALLWLISIGSFVVYKKFIETNFISYYETNNLDYSIYVNETNEFYKNKILDKEINNYVAKYIDKINVNFDYMMNFDKEVDTIYKYKVIAELKIYDRNNDNFVMNYQDYTLVNEQELSMQSTKKLQSSQSVDIDYNVYNKYVMDYRSTSNVQAKANLKIIFHIESFNKYDKITETIKRSNNIALNIPLGESTIQLTPDFVQNYQSPKIKVDTNQSIINTIFLIVFCVLGFITLILIAVVIIRTIKKHKEMSIYTKLVESLKKDFDSDITELETPIDQDETTYKYLDVKNFKELYELVKENVNKQIFWQEIKVYDENENPLNRISRFFVRIDEKTIAKFEVDENKLKKKYLQDSKIIDKYKGNRR